MTLCRYASCECKYVCVHAQCYGWLYMFIPKKTCTYACTRVFLYIYLQSITRVGYVSVCIHINGECMLACVNLCVYLRVCLRALFECTLFCFDTSSIVFASTIYCIHTWWRAYMHQMCMCLFVFIRLCLYTTSFRRVLLWNLQDLMLGLSQCVCMCVCSRVRMWVFTTHGFPAAASRWCPLCESSTAYYLSIVASRCTCISFYIRLRKFLC